MNVTTVGLGLAKSVVQVHGVDLHGKPVLKKQLRRDQVGTYFANLPSCLISIEACGSAHHWARKLESLGHAVNLMATQFVKPYFPAPARSQSRNANAAIVGAVSLSKADSSGIPVVGT